MMKKVLFCIMVSAMLLVLNSTVCSASDDFLTGYTQWHYDDNNGLNTNEVNDMIQTADGYLYFASYNGLLRYDANKFVTFSTSAGGLDAASVMCLFEDSQKRLWIGTNDNGLFCLQDNQFVKISGGDSQTSNAIRAICEDKAGRIVIASTKGMGRVNAQNELEKMPVAALENKMISNLICDSAGDFWGTTNGGDLFHISDTEVISYYTKGSVSKYESTSVYESNDGIVYVGTLGNEVIRMAGAKPEILTLENRQCINGFYEDIEGVLWVCADDGIGYFDEEFIPVEGTLVNNSVEKMLQDYEGNYWLVSTRQGALMLEKSKFTALPIEKQVVNATAIYQNRLLIAADSGLTILDEQQNPVENTLTVLLKGIRVRHLFVDSHDALWISCNEKYGLIHYQDGKYQSFTAENSALTSNKVRSVIERKNGDIAVATSDGVNIVRNNAIVKTYTMEDGLQNSTILSLYETPDGSLLAGSDGNGIYKITDEGIENFSEKDGLKAGVILRMAGDADGVFISSGNMLNYWSGDTITPMTKLEDFSSNIFDIKLLEGGRILLLTSKGIYLLDRESFSGEGEVISEFYAKKDGMSFAVTSNSWSCLTEEGMLYICGGEGVNCININNIDRNEAAPKLAINQVDVDGKVYQGGDNLLIESDCRRITIDFAALSFTSPGNCSIEYYLQGFDETPITVKSSDLAEISYTNLKGGSYQFRFSAINNDGVKSNGELVLFIEKQLGFYERTEVWVALVILLVLVVGILVYSFISARTRRILKKQEEYREITAQAIRAISHTIDAKDEYTNGHSWRVAQYSVEIANALQLPKEEIESLYFTALLHDIGKVGIPDSILNKPAALTPEEYDLIKQHTTLGGEILKEITTIKDISKGAEFHHERFDGKGYMTGLKGVEIPLFARIICVADTVDAMASERPYRDALPLEKIITELEQCRGTQFDPEIVTIMLELLRDGKIVIEYLLEGNLNKKA